jgi:hypothetical protein
MSGDISPLVMRFLCRRPSAGHTGAWPFSATEERFKLLRAGLRRRQRHKNTAATPSSLRAVRSAQQAAAQAAPTATDKSP